MRFSKEQLIEWLNSLGPNATAGTPGLDTSCPIATFVRDQTHNTYVSVDNEEIFYGSATKKLPKWAQEFVRAVDDTYKLHITAKECLEILEYGDTLHRIELKKIEKERYLAEINNMIEMLSVARQSIEATDNADEIYRIFNNVRKDIL